MSSKGVVAEQVHQAWSKLSGRWQGEDAVAFYDQYVAKLIETAEYFEDTCADLDDIATELAKELKSIEDSLSD